MTTEKVTVDAGALREVLQALVSEGFAIRELQSTRSLHKMGHPNAIETLVEQFNAWTAAPAAHEAGVSDEEARQLAEKDYEFDQRNPLNKQQMNEVVAAAHIDFCLNKYPSFEAALLRHTERAHGIKETP